MASLKRRCVKKERSLFKKKCVYAKEGYYKLEKRLSLDHDKKRSTYKERASSQTSSRVEPILVSCWNVQKYCVFAAILWGRSYWFRSHLLHVDMEWLLYQNIWCVSFRLSTRFLWLFRSLSFLRIWTQAVSFYSWVNFAPVWMHCNLSWLGERWLKLTQTEHADREQSPESWNTQVSKGLRLEPTSHVVHRHCLQVVQYCCCVYQLQTKHSHSS